MKCVSRARLSFQGQCNVSGRFLCVRRTCSVHNCLCCVVNGNYFIHMYITLDNMPSRQSHHLVYSIWCIWIGYFHFVYLYSICKVYVSLHFLCVRVCVCVRACVRACVRVCVASSSFPSDSVPTLPVMREINTSKRTTKPNTVCCFKCEPFSGNGPFLAC